jgi:hypothetical protein
MSSYVLDSFTVPGIGDFTLDKPIILRNKKPWRQRLKDFIVFSGSKSNYLSKNMIEHYLGGVAVASPANLYLALATTLPDDTTTGTTMVSTDYGSYARTQIGTANNQTDAWNAATGTTTAVVTNKNAITFPTCASTPSTNPIVGVAVVDNSGSAGNILYWASVTSTAIAVGDTPKVNAAALSVTED